VNGLRRIGPLLAVGALLAAVAVTASLATPQITSVPALHNNDGGANDIAGGPTGSPVVPSNAPRQVQHTVDLPPWLAGLLSGLCLLIVLAVVVLVLWFLLRNVGGGRRRIEAEEPAPPVAASRRSEVIAAVDAGLFDLDDNDTDPRRAVIACWVRLEVAAAAAGTPRQPGDAPADLVLWLLAAHQVSAGVLLPLADVYRLARYATHTVDSGMRDTARAALRQLRAELAAEPAMGTQK
jgi:hypothetical protein